MEGFTACLEQPLPRENRFATTVLKFTIGTQVINYEAQRPTRLIDAALAVSPLHPKIIFVDYIPKKSIEKRQSIFIIFNLDALLV